MNDTEYHLDILRKIPESKGGKLISKEYINAKSKIEFEDKNGKQFCKKPCHIKNHKFV